MWTNLTIIARAITLSTVLIPLLSPGGIGFANAESAHEYRGNHEIQQHAFVPLQDPSIQQPLHGRFLHITDLHMDSYYENGATIKSVCHQQPKKHRKKKQRKGKLAGYWGAPKSDCDSSPAFLKHTIAMLGQEWADKVDFVIWTGDNARHDIDHSIPRTKKEILKLNQVVTNQLRAAFTVGNRTVPIIPCMGNNDVHPHNQLRSLPKEYEYLSDYADMWQDMIPLDQQTTFREGGYFAIDAAPGIRILSLNTLYFFNSNEEMRGCDHPGKGVNHLIWIREQLAKAQRDKARVYMIGHVPPSTKTFYPSCLAGYIDLSLEFANVIGGQMFGHLNMDHFIVLKKQDAIANDEVHVNKDRKYLKSLRKQYETAKDDGTMFTVHVAPPMIPLYYPTFRIGRYETDPQSDNFGNWMQYTQYFTNLTFWNQYVDLQQERGIDTKPAEPIFEIEYATDTTYGLHDMSSSSWLQFARRMTRKSNTGRALWELYKSHMFVKTRDE